MHGSKSSQTGGGIIGMLATLLVIGMLITIGLKTTPVYLDDYALKKILASLDESPDGKATSVKSIRNRITRHLSTNLIKLKADEMQIYQEGDAVFVQIDYERRVDFLYNIDLILTFKHDWKAKIQ